MVERIFREIFRAAYRRELQKEQYVSLLETSILLSRSREIVFPDLSGDNHAWLILCYAVLKALKEEFADKATLASLSTLSTPTAYRKITKLREKGYVQETPDSKDFRRLLVTPTNKCFSKMDKYLKMMDVGIEGNRSQP